MNILHFYIEKHNSGFNVSVFTVFFRIIEWTLVTTIAVVPKDVGIKTN